MTYPQKSERYMKYREILFLNGFSEAKQKDGHFFRQATEQTAFVVNFEDDEESCITILYGFASTAYMAGDEEWFVNHGSYKTEKTVYNGYNLGAGYGVVRTEGIVLVSADVGNVGVKILLRYGLSRCRQCKNAQHQCK